LINILLIYALIGLIIGGITISFVFNPEFWDKDSSEDDKKENENARDVYKGYDKTTVIIVVSLVYMIFWLPMVVKSFLWK